MITASHNYPKSPFKGYDKDYHDTCHDKSCNCLGKAVMKYRWGLVQTFCESGKLLDYGCNSGVFHESAPDSFNAHGWDINPDSKYCRCRPTGKHDILTMWDVMEHLPAPLDPILEYAPSFVFITTPNAANAGFPDFTGWKHYKPLEHIHYYTLQTLSMSMGSIGYKLVYSDFGEGELRYPQNPEATLTAVYTNTG